jgi:Cu(I)/Ag(I) efflux system periplasmic protein CusF
MTKLTTHTLGHAALLATLMSTAALTALPAAAQMDHSKMGHGAGHGAAVADASEMSDAEVRKVDRDQGKLTLRHGPIRNLDMPGMTMVFTVADRAMLDGVKAGDKVRFRATNEGGRYTVVEMVPAN